MWRRSETASNRSSPENVTLFRSHRALDTRQTCVPPLVRMTSPYLHDSTLERYVNLSVSLYLGYTAPHKARESEYRPVPSNIEGKVSISPCFARSFAGQACRGRPLITFYKSDKGLTQT